MSRRDRQAARSAISKRQRQQHLAREVEREPDPQQQARLTAWYQRETRGFVKLGDRDAHYLYQLGLNDVCKGGYVSQQDTRHPDVIRTRSSL